MSKEDCLVVAIPKGVAFNDELIMKHIAKEVKSVVNDGMCDLAEYGSSTDYGVTVYIEFNRNEVENNGR